MTVVYAYLIMGVVIAAVALWAQSVSKGKQAQMVIDRLGIPIVFAAITFFWPALIVIARRNRK